MNRIALLVVSFMTSLMVCAQAIYDPKCITMMDAPLEGTDSAFIPHLKAWDMYLLRTTTKKRVPITLLAIFMELRMPALR